MFFASAADSYMILFEIYITGAIIQVTIAHNFSLTPPSRCNPYKWGKFICQVYFLLSSTEGLNNGAAFCGKVSSYGGLAMRANPGEFNSMLSLQFYIKSADNSSMPTIDVKIASDSVSRREHMIKLHHLHFEYAQRCL